MSAEPPGTMIRRARQEARMTQRELADQMGVHHTTVGYWERNKFFPEQHWAALNKLLHISLAPPGASVPAAVPPPVPDDVLAVIRKRYTPAQQDVIIEMLLEISGRDEQAGGEEGPSFPRGSGTRRAG